MNHSEIMTGVCVDNFKVREMRKFGQKLGGPDPDLPKICRVIGEGGLRKYVFTLI